MSVAQEIQRLQSAKANIKTAIENKGVTVGDGTIDTYAEKIGQISGGGGGANPFEYATFKNGLYQDAVFPENYQLDIDAPSCAALQYILYGATGIKKLTFKGNTQGDVLSLNYLARNCASIGEIDFTNLNCKVSTLNYAFGSASALHTIKGEFDLTDCTSTTRCFQSCKALTEVRFKPSSIPISIEFGDCTNLSTNTIQSIFNGLATVGTTQTLTFHSNLKILQSQVDAANAKGWTVAGGKVVSEEEYYA